MGIEVPFILLFLAIPTFFLCRWLARKFIREGVKRTVVMWIATLCLTPMIYGLIIFIWVFSISYYPSNDFDKEKWMSDKETRYELSEDLIESKLLIGKTKQQVIQILGKEENDFASDNWDYYLGFTPEMFNIDPDVLHIEFKDGKVITVSQQQT